MLNNKAFAFLFLLVILLIPSYILAQSVPAIVLTDKDKIAKDFILIGGANSDINGNVYFTDIEARRIYKIDSQNQITTFLDNSQGCDNLAFDPQDNLIACQREKNVSTNKRIVNIDINSKQINSVLETFENMPFDGLNGLVIDQQSGIYFTDSFSASVFGKGRFQDTDAVYYRSPTGSIVRVIANEDTPNAIVLSPDEKTLYVCYNNLSGLMSYPIIAPGKVGVGHKILDLGLRDNNMDAVTSRLTVDVNSNLYLATFDIAVISPEGEIIQKFIVPERVSSCAFGGKDFKTLYIFTRESVYSIKSSVAGYHIGLSDFDLEITPNDQAIIAGMSADFSIKAKSTDPFNPFIQPINLSATITPTNDAITLSLDSNIITTSTTRTLTVNTSKGIAGIFNLTLIATVGEITKTFTHIITIIKPVEPDFDIAFDSDNLNLNRGQNSQIKLNIIKKDGFAENVTINVPDTTVLKTLRVVITPSSQSTNDSIVNFNIRAKKKAKRGSQTLIFTAKDSNGRTKTALLNLTIQ